MKTNKKLKMDQFFIRLPIVLFLVVAPLVQILLPAQAQAADCSEAARAIRMENQAKNNVPGFFDPCAGTCDGASLTITGKDNAEKILNFLLTKGFNAAQASGILGNISHESGFNPFRMQTTYESQGIDAVLPVDSHKEYMKAFGIVQWDGGRRQNILRIISAQFPDFKTTINAYGKSGDDPTQAPENDLYLEVELEFLYQELSEGYKSVYDDIKALPNDEAGMEQAASIWNRRFEVSADSNSNRIASARPFYEEYKDRTTASEATDSASGCGTGTPAGEIVHYYQCDERWANSGYAGDTMCAAGCGPTSMAMILTALVDKNITPMDVVAVAGSQSGGTSDWNALTNGVSAKWGVKIESTTSFDDMYAFLKAGQGMVWVGGSAGNGSVPPFTNGGHLIALTGVASNGNIMVADSAGGAHPATAEYTADQIGRSHTFFKVYKK